MQYGFEKGNLNINRSFQICEFQQSQFQQRKTKSEDLSMNFSNLSFSKGRQKSEDLSMNFSNLSFSKGRQKNEDLSMNFSNLSFSKGSQKSEDLSKGPKRPKISYLELLFVSIL